MRYIKNYIKSSCLAQQTVQELFGFSTIQNILHLTEGQLFTINCSNTLYGYPVPEVSIHLDNHKSSVSRREVSDSYNGTIVTAYLSAVALKQWHHKPIYCSLHGNGIFHRKTNRSSCMLTVNVNVIHCCV